MNSTTNEQKLRAYELRFSVYVRKLANMSPMKARTVIGSMADVADVDRALVVESFDLVVANDYIFKFSKTEIYWLLDNCYTESIADKCNWLGVSRQNFYKQRKLQIPADYIYRSELVHMIAIKKVVDAIELAFRGI